MQALLKPRPKMASPWQEQVKRALRDQELWDILTASEADCARVYNELKRIHDDIGRQMQQRNMNLARDREVLTDEERQAFRDWMTSVQSMRRMLKQRMVELYPRAQRAQGISERDIYRAAILDLAIEVYLHQSGERDDADLYRMIAEITIPHGPGKATLFDVAAEVLGDDA